MSVEPGGFNGGALTNLQWKQGTRTIGTSVLPSEAAGTTDFDVYVQRFTDVRWLGGAKIAIPKDANDLHYFVLVGDT